jgi:hypothetical protein
MLISRGYNVAFVLDDGRRVRAAKSAEILHDPSGSDWPSDSAIAITFKHTGKTLKDPPKDARKQLGDGFEPKRGRVVLPSRRLSGWREVGLVESVEFHRRGVHFREEGHEHDFTESTFFIKGKQPTLYKLGSAYRMDGFRYANWKGFR